MGAWGTGSFQNDGALDWLAVLQQTGVKGIVAAFSDVENAEYLDGDIGCNAIAAAEAVAAINGKMMQKAPRELVAWSTGKPTPSPELIEQARTALNRVLEKSELWDLWEESGNFQEWRAGVEDVLARLK